MSWKLHQSTVLAYIHLQRIGNLRIQQLLSCQIRIAGGLVPKINHRVIKGGSAVATGMDHGLDTLGNEAISDNRGRQRARSLRSVGGKGQEIAN